MMEGSRELGVSPSLPRCLEGQFNSRRNFSRAVTWSHCERGNQGATAARPHSPVIDMTNDPRAAKALATRRAAARVFGRATPIAGPIASLGGSMI